MSDMRINARLDEETADDLQFLRHELGGASITNILKYSLHRMAQELRDRNRAKRQKKVWSESGFVGRFSADEDLSANYKWYLARRLDEKYPAGE